MNLLIYSKNWNAVRNFMVGTAFAVAASGQALAQTAVSIEPPATDSSSTSPTFAPKQLELTPYVWGMHINSDDQIGGKPLDANLPLHQILDSLKGLGELEAVGRYHGLFVLADGIYASLGLTPQPRIPSIYRIDLQATFATVAGGYSFSPIRVLGEGDKALYVNIQPFVGASYSDLVVNARSSTTPAQLSENWWMPVVGARIDGRTGNTIIRLGGDVSPFGNSERREQIIGSVGHEFQNPRLGYPTLQIGYRYLYEKKVPDPSETLRLKLQGPVLFVTFHLK